DDRAVRAAAELVVLGDVDLLEDLRPRDVGHVQLEVLERLVLVDVEQVQVDVGAKVRVRDQVGDRGPRRLHLLERLFVQDLVQLILDHLVDRRHELLDGLLVEFSVGSVDVVEQRGHAGDEALFRGDVLDDVVEMGADHRARRFDGLGEPHALQKPLKRYCLGHLKSPCESNSRRRRRVAQPSSSSGPTVTSTVLSCSVTTVVLHGFLPGANARISCLPGLTRIAWLYWLGSSSSSSRRSSARGVWPGGSGAKSARRISSFGSSVSSGSTTSLSCAAGSL